jgi:hypothetical protein
LPARYRAARPQNNNMFLCGYSVAKYLSRSSEVLCPRG